MVKQTTDVVVTVRAKAFGGRAEDVRCSVSPEGTVRVWDSVAGYYTTCHSMGKAAQERVRKLAREALAAGTACVKCGRDPMLCECVTEHSQD
jgi:hypothetical protein